MSWQRIDENTYIDDTLVTCAEYQLFIDEMREQGKYYQPDHWTSYQFPQGQAREPILGVRQSDAVAFCKWLTQRNGEWRFRLLTQAEVVASHLKPFRGSPLGYWLNEKSHFTWISAVSIDPHDLDLEMHRVLDYAPAFDLEFARNLKDVFARNLDHPSSRNLDITLNEALNRNFNHDYALDDDRDRDRALVRTNSLHQDLYADIHALQERIAGRSPAFEGIRLVKERIR